MWQTRRLLPDTLKNEGIKSQIYSDPIEMIYYSAYKDAALGELCHVARTTLLYLLTRTH